MSCPKVFFAAICIFAVDAPAAFSQTPKFEVASIKLSPEGGLPMVVAPGLRNGMLHGQRLTLRMLLAAAYGMTEPRIIGPGWLDSDRFDILAKSPEGVPDSAKETMLQALLQDRFKPVAHLTMREMPVYFLEVAKSGVKMPIYPAQDRGPDRPGHQYPGAAMMRGTGTTAQIAFLLSRIVNRPVLDRTGLTDRYNFFLFYAPLSPRNGDHEAELDQPDIFAAIQEQLGLKFQPGRDNVQVVVVDHIERMPTEN